MKKTILLLYSIMLCLWAWTLATHAQNICIEYGPHPALWSCLTNGWIQNAGTLNLTHIDACVGETIVKPTFATSPTFLNGVMTRTVTYDCSAPQTQNAPVAYLPPFLYFEDDQGLMPDIFNSPVSKTYTAKVRFDPSPLAGWWPGEDNAEDVVFDNNGIVQGGLTFGAGKVGQGFVFSTSTAHVRVPANPNLNVGANGLTIEAWIKPSDLSKRNPIVEWNNGTGLYGVHFYILAPGELGLGAGNLQLNLVDTYGGNHQLLAPGGAVTTDEFRHVVATYDKATGVARIYTNGVMAVQGSLGVFTLQTRYDLYLGRRPAGGGTHNYSGLMDEVSIYNCTLSDSQINAIYTAGSAGKCRDGSLAGCAALPAGCVCAPVTAEVGTVTVNIWGSTDTDYDGRSDCQEINDGTNPLDENSVLEVRLGYWRFNDTLFLGEEGQSPLLSSNLQNVASWSGNAVKLDSTNAASLAYRDVETNGLANINCRNGALRFWFKGNWSSGTNATSGPKSQARLIELGSQGTTNGWWGLVLNTNGTQLSFITQTNGTGTTNFSAAINWQSNTWHEVVLSYSPSNSLLYVDGQAVITDGMGVANYPGSTVRASGFGLGSSQAGSQQARGQFEELETFNFQLDSTSISNEYLLSQPYLGAPSITLTSNTDALEYLVTAGHPDAGEIVSPVWESSYINPIAFSVADNYSDSLFARQIDHFDSSTAGINITKLPSPVISPNGGDFNYASNVVISLGSEDLVDLVEGLYQTELGRMCEPTELDSGVSYAQDLRDNELTDEEIRATLINNLFRNSSEYASKYITPGDVYVANTNYTIEYSTNAASWIIYTGAIQVAQSLTLQARLKKAGTQDNRTHYSYLTSQSAEAQFTLIPISWLIQHFGTNYSSNPNAAAHADADSDGLENWQEHQLGANPNNPDTDDDGRSDGQELADGTDPLSANSVLATRLGYWRFNNTNTWMGEQGQLPLSFTNIQGSASWSTYAVQIDSNNAPASLRYRVAETTGAANLRCQVGTIRFFFKPNWDSSTTNNGTGPQSEGRLVEIGSEESAPTNGWWSLIINSNGTAIRFVTQTNGNSAVNLTSTVNWKSNEWHEVVLTYSATNSSLYIDGVAAVTSGSGVQYYPSAVERANGFGLGSSKGGTQQAKGQFEELETFNYVLNSGEVETNFNTIKNRDSDGDGLTDFEEACIPIDPSNPGAGCLDPFNPDTGNTGKRDGRKDSDQDLITNLGELRSYQSDPAKPRTFNATATDAEYFVIALQSAAPPAPTPVRLIVTVHPQFTGLLFSFEGGTSAQLWEVLARVDCVCVGDTATCKWVVTGIQAHPGDTPVFRTWANLPGGGCLPTVFQGALVADTDFDGLTDGQEARVFGTVIDDPDTDNDGLSDGAEVIFETDPKNPDTDGDGMEDGLEVALGRNPNVKEANVMWFVPPKN